MPDVYISHSVSPWELAQVYALVQETQRQGLDAYIPDRNWNPAMGLPDYLKDRVQQARVVLMFATIYGHYPDWVNQEVDAAARFGTRVMALKEKDVIVSGILPVNIVEFDRSEDMSQVIQRVTQHLQGLLPQRPASNLLTGLVVGGLVLLLLRGLGGGGEHR